MVLGDEGRSAACVDTATGRAIAELPRHDGIVTDAAFSPEPEQQVATVGQDGTATVADAGTGRLLRTLSPDAGKLTTVG